MLRLRYGILVALAAGLGCFWFLGRISAPMAAPELGQVRLAVLIIFDQLRGDYLARWNDLYGERGFRRLESGIWFQNCHYPYSATLTGPGHASLATGLTPSEHGIVANDWYDRRTNQSAYCATSFRYRRVPLVPPKAERAAASEDSEPGSGAPDQLLAPALADVLKQANGKRSKVVSLSLKDRGAAFTGGRHPDACYWFDTDAGSFVTSTCYRDTLHPWVARFNAGRLADRWFHQPWQRLRPDLDYAAHSGPDDVPSEDVAAGQGRVFPHPLDAGLKAPGRKYFGNVYCSPFGNELLLAFARTAIDYEQLGHHEGPDLLCVSFSSNDAVGHTWGPDSQEVMDTTLRTDLIVQELLDHLDARVGKDRYIVALSADHGVCPLPELAAQRGLGGKRVPGGKLLNGISEFLKTTFPTGTDKPVKRFTNDSVYLNDDWVKAQSVPRSEIETALAAWLKTQPDVQAAYARSTLRAGIAAEDQLGGMVERSFHPERSGDVIIVFKPYRFISSGLRGTTHGSPHPYDTHVPLVVFGPGLVNGVRTDRVTPQANVAILAHALDVKPPTGAPVVEKVFRVPGHSASR